MSPQRGNQAVFQNQKRDPGPQTASASKVVGREQEQLIEGLKKKLGELWDGISTYKPFYIRYWIKTSKEKFLNGLDAIKFSDSELAILSTVRKSLETFYSLVREKSAKNSQPETKDIDDIIKELDKLSNHFGDGTPYKRMLDLLKDYLGDCKRRFFAKELHPITGKYDNTGSRNSKDETGGALIEMTLNMLKIIEHKNSKPGK